MEQPDLDNSMHNRFVQDYLSAMMKQLEDNPEPLNAEQVIEYDHFQYVLDTVQELYSYEDDEKRKAAIATGGELDICLGVLERFMTIVPDGHELYKGLELTYALVNATKQIAKES